MGKREKKPLASKSEEYIPFGAVSSDDDAAANEDLSLKIIQKSMSRAANTDPMNNGVSEIDTDLKKKEKKKRKKSSKVDEEDAVSSDVDTGFRDFCEELFLVDNVKDSKEEQGDDQSNEITPEVVEANPVEVSDNVVLRKLLRGPRYFDPPDDSWGACYNCGEEGHTTVNCTSAKRKKPCFVCGSFEHNAKHCTKGRDCFICKQHGHRAKDCPEKNKNSVLCLKCGDQGHDMFSCRNDYCPDDLKEIQCYVCGRPGHLCCVNYSDPGPTEVSCYRCGLSGHTGLACTGYRGDITDYVASNSCYRCGLEGHFARECTSSLKASKRNRESSTPKQRSSKKNKDHMEVRSAPHDLGKKRKKKKSQYEEFTPATKTKHRGRWITEHPGEFYSDYKTKTDSWRSPATPRDRRSDGDYASSSHSAKKARKINYNNNSASNGSVGYYQHGYSASRFGKNSYDGMGRNYNRNSNWW